MRCSNYSNAAPTSLLSTINTTSNKEKEKDRTTFSIHGYGENYNVGAYKLHITKIRKPHCKQRNLQKSPQEKVKKENKPH